MNQNMKVLTIALSAFVVGSAVNNYAMSVETPSQCKIAVVDIQKVAASSAQVRKLAEDRKAKLTELKDFVTKARADVSAQKNADKKKALEDKYNKELNDKKVKIEQDYAANLATVDKNISDVISQKAKEKNYDIVLMKGVVLYGGSDITDTVAQSVK